jgi:MFS family permease
MSFIQFLRENLRWLAGGFLLCFFSSIGQTFFISLSGGQIRAEYGLSNGQFGSLYMVATLASAITLPFLGRIVDHLPVSRCALIVMPLLATACVMMSVSQSVVLLGLTIYALRLLGQGMMTHTSLTAMGRWFSRYRGRAVSVATLGHQAGEAVLPLTMTAVFALLGWRMSWLVAAAFLLCIALPVVHRLMRTERQPQPGERQHPRSAPRHWQQREVLRDPMFWIMLIGVLAPGFIGTTVFFHQAYLLELRQWPPELFATAFVAMASMTLLFALLTGLLIDRVGAPTVLPLYQVPLALCCFALAGIAEPKGIFVFMGLLGVSYGISSTLFGALWPEVYGTRHLGSVRSITVALMVLATALGPGVSGLLIDAGVSYFSQFRVMGSYCLVAALVMIVVSRRLVQRLAAERAALAGTSTT